MQRFFAAFNDLAENAVAPAVGIGCFEVEEVVVGNVDEELRGGRMRVGGARHGDGVVVVLQAVVGFVLDRVFAIFLFHARLEAAALDHEARDDAVENGVVVVAGFNVRNEILGRLWRFFGIEFEGDNAKIGV